MRSCMLLLSLLCLTGMATAQSFQPDPLFGNAGMVITAEANKTSVLYAIAIQPDGKIIAAGMDYEENGQMDYHTFLVRYHTNGSIDNSFGANGKVRTAVGQEDIAYAIAMQPDGKIVIAGNETVIVSIDSTSATITSRPFLARYLSSGALDNTFGVNGIHRLEILNPFEEKYLSSLAIRPDGMILAGGGAGFAGQPVQMLVVGLHPDGTYNSNFGTGGVSRIGIEPGKSAVLNDMALQPDGNLVLTGYSGTATITAPPNTAIAVVRLLQNGSLDATFGSGGKVVTQVSAQSNPFDAGQSVAIQDDGKIVVAGAVDRHLALLRFYPNGSADMTFGNNGIVLNSTIPPATDLCIDKEGKLITAGLLGHQNPYTTDIHLARHQSNGAIDQNFGNAGMLVIDRSDRDQAYALQAQPDGKIILGGHTTDMVTGRGSFTLFRFTDNNSGTGIDAGGMPGYDIRLYPNPVADLLHIAFDRLPAGTVSLKIINAAGKVCDQAYTRKAITTLNTRKLRPGFYILQLTLGKEQKILPFIVER